MNYFAHGQRFVEDPYLLAGTAVPDWLNVSDRGTRIRPRDALPWCHADDPLLASLARGIVQHHDDDAWFHSHAVFAQLQYSTTARLRDALAGDEGMRPSFLGHILVEILLDAALIARAPANLEAYYDALSQIDPARLGEAAARLAPRPCPRLPLVVAGFCRERFLWDYLDDAKLWVRLNQVMRRVGLNELPATMIELLAELRPQVANQADALVTPQADDLSSVDGK